MSLSAACTLSRPGPREGCPMSVWTRSRWVQGCVRSRSRSRESPLVPGRGASLPRPGHRTPGFQGTLVCEPQSRQASVYGEELHSSFLSLISSRHPTVQAPRHRAPSARGPRVRRAHRPGPPFRAQEVSVRPHPIVPSSCRVPVPLTKALFLREPSLPEPGSG